MGTVHSEQLVGTHNGKILCSFIIGGRWPSRPPCRPCRCWPPWRYWPPWRCRPPWRCCPLGSPCCPCWKRSRRTPNLYHRTHLLRCPPKLLEPQSLNMLLLDPPVPKPFTKLLDTELSKLETTTLNTLRSPKLFPTPTLLSPPRLLKTPSPSQPLSSPLPPSMLPSPQSPPTKEPHPLTL